MLEVDTFTVSRAVFSCLAFLIVVGTLYDIIYIRGGWLRVRKSTLKEMPEAEDDILNPHVGTSMANLVEDEREQPTPGMLQLSC